MNSDSPAPTHPTIMDQGHYQIEKILTHEMDEKAARMEVRSFSILPNPTEPNDRRLARALQDFTNLTCSELPSGVRYSIAVNHHCIPFKSGNMFVNYREHTGREGEMIVDLIRTLMQSSKPIAYTDSFNLEFATYDFTK